jgi:hypothetical protein
MFGGGMAKSRWMTQHGKLYENWILALDVCVYEWYYHIRHVEMMLAKSVLTNLLLNFQNMEQ